MDRMTIANPSLRLYDDKRLNIATSYIYIYILNLELLEIFSFYESFDKHRSREIDQNFCAFPRQRYTRDTEYSRIRVFARSINNTDSHPFAHENHLQRSATRYTKYLL